ncbi:class I SAM-dependent DNA methyltransferase, partial [bacterium]|nr:class I SAM-dependent DNA methyltransferase [bacterium]
FWNDFFNVFGISRRRVAGFEEPVKKLGNKQGFIDLFWKGTLLVEHKSKGKNLDAAFEQATDYFHGIKEHELPKYVLVSDFERFRLYDLDEKTEDEFHLKELHKNIKLFGFIAGYQKRTFRDEDPVNITAAELMGRLHDQLEDSGYEGHQLEVFLVRLLFCLFADDTGIFEKDTFKEFIEQRTHEDGSDLGAWLAQFFQVLNTPREKRLRNLDEQLNAFPYINGKLYEEPLPIAAFSSKMREILLKCSALDWGKISPAIFGSMFQSVMNPEERRNLGAHYTSEKNIMKLIKPLFLDELKAEFQRIKTNRNRLKEFHQKLSSLKFLDPACGCGNFLIITYRELRLLELKVLKALYGDQQATAIDQILHVDVDQFYGIEYDEFPARIAEVAMWLMDHQMNLKVSEEFGLYYARLPLRKAAKIVNGNALRIDWESVVPKSELNYILGNPPFCGKQHQNAEQKTDMKNVFDGVKGAGILDYVSAWYIRASKYIQNTKIKVAFVSTNSLAQGEQVGILWN